MLLANSLLKKMACRAPPLSISITNIFERHEIRNHEAEGSKKEDGAAREDVEWWIEIEVEHK